MKDYLEAGKAVNTHGVRGHIKVQSYCDSTAVFCSLKTLYIEKKGEFIPVKVEKSSPHKGMVLCKLENSETYEDAILYKNKILYCKRDDIPRDEGDHFIVDLIGLPVYNIETGKVYGKLKEVIDNPANDLYAIECETGISYIPCVAEFVKDINLEKGIAISPIEGMFDEI